MSAAFFAELEAALGPEAVDRSEATVAAYGVTTLPEGDRRPPGVVRPGSTAEVQQVVRCAIRHGVALYPTSTGWNLGLGSRAPGAAAQVVVDLAARMKRIIEVDEELAFAVVEPGVTFTALHEELQARGSRLMISPTSGPPLGGLIGNALDRGAGAGPYGDHFGMSCGLEIVLGTGEVIRTGDGSLDQAETPNWHVSKYSFGPALDGLFTQSNFGIVTRMGMWLQPRPPLVRGFFFTFPEDDDLAEIIELIRPLKQGNAVPTLIRATNDLYLAGAHQASPEYGQTGGVVSAETRRALQRAHGVGAWTVSGAVYGADRQAAELSIARLRAHFQASGRAAYVDEDAARQLPAFGAALASNAGVPGSGELGLLKWRPADGAIWFLPGLPMRGAVAQACDAAGRGICAAHGIDYMVSNVCGPRYARSIHALIFNREDPAERARADACYRALEAAYRKQGISVGRAPTDYHGLHQGQRTQAFRETCGRIKSALDPAGVIAPGRYGIDVAPEPRSGQ